VGIPGLSASLLRRPQTGVYEKYNSVLKEVASVWDEIPDRSDVFRRMDEFFASLLNEGLKIKAADLGSHRAVGSKVSSHLPICRKLTTHGEKGRVKKR
jgi:hypothetical protein